MATEDQLHDNPGCNMDRKTQFVEREKNNKDGVG